MSEHCGLMSQHYSFLRQKVDHTGDCKVILKETNRLIVWVTSTLFTTNSFAQAICYFSFTPFPIVYCTTWTTSFRGLSIRSYLSRLLQYKNYTIFVCSKSNVMAKVQTNINKIVSYIEIYEKSRCNKSFDL